MLFVRAKHSLSGGDMLYLKTGAKGPKVATIQILLNQFTLKVNIPVDGEFGPKTRDAVEQFQRSLTPPLKVDGIFGSDSWAAMRRLSGDSIVNLVDSVDAAGSADAISRLQFAGSSVFDAWSNIVVVMQRKETLADAARRIIASVKPGSIALLRFFGHGDAGDQGISAGKAASTADTAIIHSNVVKPRYRQLLYPIRMYMCPYGSAELHGCNIGRGHKGTLLLQQLADLWGVPVSGGIPYQYDAGSNRAVFCFEGNVKTLYPHGLCLKAWAKKQQAVLEGFKARNAA